MATKTPVSILQEMMAKQGRPPQYDLIYDGCGTHEALFKYKVYADNVTAVGSGRSKKEAKHDAAKKALERLALFQITSSKEQTEMEAVEVISPYKDKVQDNAVGLLHDLCVMYEIPLPEYEHVDETGPPHERIFTYVCCISKLREKGIGRTKKQAKQLAANNMLNRLKEYLGDMVLDRDSQTPEIPETLREILGLAKKRKLDEDEPETFKEKIQTYVSKASPKKKVKLNDYPALYSKVLLNTADDIVKELADLRVTGDIEVDCTDEHDASYWEDLVSVFTEKMQLTAMWKDFVHPKGDELVESQSSAPPFIVFIQLSTTPEFVVFGYGKTEEIARKDAAIQCINFLCRMTRKSDKVEAKPEPETVLKEECSEQ